MCVKRSAVILDVSWKSNWLGRKIAIHRRISNGGSTQFQLAKKKKINFHYFVCLSVGKFNDIFMALIAYRRASHRVKNDRWRGEPLAKINHHRMSSDARRNELIIFLQINAIRHAISNSIVREPPNDRQDTNGLLANGECETSFGWSVGLFASL